MIKVTNAAKNKMVEVLADEKNEVVYVRLYISGVG